MSHGPSTFGSMTTSSFEPTAATISSMSSRSHGELSALTRVHRPVAPKSLAFAIAMKPARAACLASAGIASSRLPSTTSTSAISSGTLARSFSMCGGTKWIMRSSFTGSSRSGAGAPIASGLKKLRGSFICLIPRLKRGVLDYGMKERPGLAKRFYIQAREWMSARAAARLLERDIGLPDHLTPELPLLDEELRRLRAAFGDGLHLNSARFFGYVRPSKD